MKNDYERFPISLPKNHTVLVFGPTIDKSGMVHDFFHMRYLVYVLEKGWEDPHPNKQQIEADEYDDARSTYLLYCVEGILQAGCRIVHHTNNINPPLPISKVWPKIAIFPESVEVSRITTWPDLTPKDSYQFSTRLCVYAGKYVHETMRDVHYAYASARPGLLKRLRRVTHFEILEEPRPHKEGGIILVPIIFARY